MMIIPVAAAMASCSHKTSAVAETSTPQQSTPVVMGSGVRSLPKATAFKMNGDYANQVGVTIGSDGKLTYFPAPTDITANSAPVSLGDGWWLNRQGLSAGSVFTRWTFEEYSKLKKVPAPEEILKAVIPGSKVESFTVLPYTQTGVLNHLEDIKNFLKGPSAPAPAPEK